jgi:hypothetical protein
MIQVDDARLSYHCNPNISSRLASNHTSRLLQLAMSRQFERDLRRPDQQRPEDSLKCQISLTGSGIVSSLSQSTRQYRRCPFAERANARAPAPGDAPKIAHPRRKSNLLQHPLTSSTSSPKPPKSVLADQTIIPPSSRPVIRWP